MAVYLHCQLRQIKKRIKMKITIEIKTTEEIMPANMLRELSQLIDESKDHEMNRKYIQWSGETIDVIINQE